MVTFQLVTRARGRPTFQDTPSEPLDANRRNPCRNGSNTPRSADRRLRDGPRRRHEYPWTMPGGSWSMENRGLAQGGACPFPSSQGRVGQAGLLFRGEWVQPALVPLPALPHSTAHHLGGMQPQNLSCPGLTRTRPLGTERHYPPASARGRFVELESDASPVGLSIP